MCVGIYTYMYIYIYVYSFLFFMICLNIYGSLYSRALIIRAPKTPNLWKQPHIYIYLYYIRHLKSNGLPLDRFIGLSFMPAMGISGAAAALIGKMLGGNRPGASGWQIYLYMCREKERERERERDRERERGYYNY